jgi:hypothetical protein
MAIWELNPGYLFEGGKDETHVKRYGKQGERDN